MSLADRSILITGGTGSFGQAFVTHAIAAGAKRIVVFSRDERKQEDMAQAIGWNESSPVRFMLGDVRDQGRIGLALRGIDTVIHAAALKIVPRAEYDPIETIETNVNGTSNVILAAIHSGSVNRMILLSTDKAVSPVNLYGATKQCAEKLMVAANNLSGSVGWPNKAGHSPCRFSVVRYGNVAGSRGSVIPLFKKLKEEGKPLPITHLDMTRFWITLITAVDIVEAALEDMVGGEIYVPYLPAFRITDLVEVLGPISVRIVGMRPGEKLHEELISEYEARMTELKGEWFIIQPPWNKPAIPMADGFKYRSDTPIKFLDVEYLRGVL